jgi:gas vesicle protein
MADGAGKFWGGLLIGSAIGAAAGILLTPRSGKETRHKLSSSIQYHADRLADQLGDQLTEISESAQKTLDDTTERVQEAIAAGQEASRKLSQELKIATPVLPSIEEEAP